MALTFPKRGFAGAPVAGTLKTPGLTASDGAGVTFQSSTTLTGWTDITGGTFSGAYLCVTFGYGTATEEKILCTYNSATSTFTISQRGYDGTTAQAWVTGSLFILTWTATEAAELNATTQALKTILTNSGTTTTPQPISVGSGTGAIGTGTVPAAIDHDHKISASTLNSFLGGSSANATLGTSLLVPLANLVSGALPSGVTIPLSQVTNPPAADTQTNTGNAALTTTSSTTNTLSTNVNPAGSFKQYVWRVTAQQQNAASAQNDLTPYIRYRVVGTSTWTTVAATPMGTAVTPNDFRSFSAGGTVTLSTADDYEFNVSFATSTGTVTLNRTTLTVQGLN